MHGAGVEVPAPTGAASAISGAFAELAGSALSLWKIGQKKRCRCPAGGGLRRRDALYDSDRFLPVKLTGTPFV
jgi:hypothetical protein